MQAKSLVRQLRGAGLEVPILAVVAEGGWAAVTADWGADDVILHTAGPGEVDARLRLAIGRRTVSVLAAAGEIRRGDLVIDEASYLARLRGRTLDLTFKEFELLKFLAQHPARVFTRSQLLQEVWGYDYFGGTRTVDVHVRRLRAKLGVEHELLIGTVRNVGYRFVPSQGKTDARGAPAGASGEPDADAARRAGKAGRRPAELRGGGPALHTPADNAPGPAGASAGGMSTGVPGTITGAPGTSTGSRELSVRGRISESEAAAVLALVSAATEEDGVGPLSEHVMLHLRYGGDPRARNLLLYDQRELAGYAHLDPTDPVEGPSGELVIHPAHRGQGLGLATHSRPGGRGRRPAAPAMGARRSAGRGQARDRGGFRPGPGTVADAALAAGQARPPPACGRPHHPHLRGRPR